jgi:hypothetical protein
VVRVGSFEVTDSGTITDLLLSENTGLRVRDDPTLGPLVDGLTLVQASSANEALHTLRGFVVSGDGPAEI